jgi:hypothetical protein
VLFKVTIRFFFFLLFFFLHPVSFIPAADDGTPSSPGFMLAGQNLATQTSAVQEGAFLATNHGREPTGLDLKGQTDEKD